MLRFCARINTARYLYRWKNAEKCRLNNISDSIFASEHDLPDVPHPPLTVHNKILDRLHKITYSMRPHGEIGITNFTIRYYPSEIQPYEPQCTS